MDVLYLLDVLENFVTTSVKQYGSNPLYSYSSPRCTLKAGLKHSIVKLEF